MKNPLLLIAAIALCVLGCTNTNDNPNESSSSQSSSSSPNSSSQLISTSQFIPIDSANKMLESYLNSINYSQNDTDLQSLVISVDKLEQYLNQIPGNITHFKLMFAHRLDYINDGHANQYAGYKRDALTLIIAGSDINGDYVYYDDSLVTDYSSPCPPGCPPGSAGNPLLVQ